MEDDYRRRLGERLVLARITAGWSVAEAARRTKVDRGTIESAEGRGNVGIGLMARYAETLGLSLEQVCADALRVQPRHGLDVDEQLILLAYQRGNVAQRDALRALARTFAPAEVFPAQQASAAAPADDPVAEPGSEKRARRARGRR